MAENETEKVPRQMVVKLTLLERGWLEELSAARAEKLGEADSLSNTVRHMIRDRHGERNGQWIDRGPNIAPNRVSESSIYIEVSPVIRKMVLELAQSRATRLGGSVNISETVRTIIVDRYSRNNGKWIK